MSGKPHIFWHPEGAFVFAGVEGMAHYSLIASACSAGWTRQTTLRRLAKHEYDYGRGMWTRDPQVAAKFSEYVSCFDALERLTAYRESIEASRATSADFQPPRPEGLAYYPFQRAGIKWMSERRGTLLADEMGVGKTIQIIGTINTLECERSLIVVPSALRENWRRELTTWLTLDGEVQVIATTEEDPDPQARVIVASYGMLAYTPRTGALKTRLDKTTSSIERLRLQGDSASRHDRALLAGLLEQKAEVEGKLEAAQKFVPLHRRLAKLSFNLLACDEAHKLKNPDSLRTKAVLKGLIPSAERVILATGTPILNSVPELWTLINAIDPAIYDDERWFMGRYAVFRDVHYNGRKARKFVGARNAAELHEKLRGTVMLRRLKHDVIDELPAKTRSIHVIPADHGLLSLASSESTLHDEVEALQEEILSLRETPDSAVLYADKIRQLNDVRQLKMHQLARARSSLAEAKLPLMVRIIEGFLETVPKLVFFAHHKTMVRGIYEHFKDHAVVIDGSVSDKVREEAVSRFQTDDTVSLFVGSIHACGVGFTLTAASHAVFGELDWTPALNVQAEDRIHRIGQKWPCTIYYPVVNNSVDSRIAKRLVAKQGVADAILDGVEA